MILSSLRLDFSAGSCSCVIVDVQIVFCSIAFALVFEEGGVGVPGGSVENCCVITMFMLVLLLFSVGGGGGVFRGVAFPKYQYLLFCFCVCWRDELLGL